MDSDKRADKVYNTEPDVWGEQVKFNWDYQVKSQRFCFDMNQKKFEESYPNGLILGFMSLKEFDKYLCHYSRRDEGELWKVGSTYGLAKMIIYLTDGNPIVPPVIKPVENNEVIFQGGHLSYAVAKASGQDLIPLYALPEHVEKLNQFMKINWINR